MALRGTGQSAIHAHVTFLADNKISVKLTGWHKKTAGGMRIGWPSGQMTLQHDEAIHLRNLLSQWLAVGTEPDPGEYIVIRLDETDDRGDGAEVAQRIAGVLSRPELVNHLTGGEFSEELLSALQGHVRLRELRSAVDELRGHLQRGDDDEAVYQRWCDRHPWAFGSAWLGRDQIRTIGVGDQVDELLPVTATGLRDVLELKRPSHSVLGYDKVHRNYYFSSQVSQAIGQCHRYLDVMHLNVGTTGLRDHPEVVGYHPRAVIVIGRSAGWDKGQLHALHGLNSRLHGITVVTYDQLLRQGERALEMLQTDGQKGSDEQ